MNFKDILELIKRVDESNLKEFKIKNKDLEIRIRTDKDTGPPIISGGAFHTAEAPVIAPVPAAQAAPAPAPASGDAQAAGAGDEAASNLIEVKSPMVGTFYRAPSPDKPQFVQVGDSITKGKVVCIIEAMKLFNEIESEVAGTIVKVLVDDASPVEYDQPLFLVESA